MEKKKVIIIGAGPAGLTAAYELLKTNKEKYDITILEETNEIGGISKTVVYKNNRMDIGGHRFFSKNEEVMNLWKELMPLQGYDSIDDKILGRSKSLSPDGPDPEKQDVVMLLRDRYSRIYYLKKFFDYPISLKIETFKNMGLKRTIKAGFSYLGAVIHKRKENSLEDFYINRFGKCLYSMFFEKYTEKLWGRHPSQISADWGAQRVKGVSVLEVLKEALKSKSKKKKGENVESNLEKIDENTETSLIEQFWYPKYGPGQLWEVLAQRVEDMGAKIKKNCKVKELKAENGKIVSVKYENMADKKTDNKIEDLEELSADIFLSTMPLKELVLGMGEIVPQNIRNIAEGLPYRDFITIGLLLKKINLKNETDVKTLGNIVPDCWIYMQEPDVRMCRIQIFNNWSPYLVEKPEENIWIGLEYVCSEKDDIWQMSEEEFRNFSVNELVKINLIDENDVLDYHIEKVKKAYPAYFDTYSQIDEIIEYIDKYDNLYCIGRNGQHRYNNMDHSMLTAIEAVKNIENGNKNRKDIWNVNTEKEYHEQKITEN